ncbi:MAG: hypothetical protein GX279_00030 [Clostridiaceae bacterium]|nr:hypothetical protein [Clostridiaceae bacterium]
MILYSIVPPEIVFNGFEGDAGIKHIQGEYRGEKVLVVRMTDGSYTMSRLISTRPSSFLDPAFQPGTTVNERELK